MNSSIVIRFADGGQEKAIVTYSEWMELFRSGTWCGKKIESVEVINSEKHSATRIKFA